EVAITYCTLALLEDVVFPKCCAAFTASAANCDCDGCLGAAVASSRKMPPNIPAWFPAGVPRPLQNAVPAATSWQYWVTVFSHALAPPPLKKLFSSAASPLGSPLFHCLPHNTR